MSASLSSGHIVIVDDDPDILIAARLALGAVAQRIEALSSPDELKALLRKIQPDAVLLDMNFRSSVHKGQEGMECLEHIRSKDETISVVCMTAYGEVPLAVEALKKGAVDFVLKPWQNEKLLATVSSAIALARSRRETLTLKAQNTVLATEAAASPEAIIGSAPSLRQVFDVVQRAAPTDASVLILGESGTGKELTARAIHRQSLRANRPFISVDMGAISENLFESELFGHKRGSFTGAVADRVGRFVAADGGTLFLDEIGNLPLHCQRKLLTVLENREVIPVGATSSTPINVRLITATNRSLAELSREEIFRQDLLFRIKTVEIVLPSLRDRREDIPVLLEHFLGVYARKYNGAKKRLARECLELLENYSWPGNIRELKYAIERAVILAQDEILGPSDFPFVNTPSLHEPPIDSLNLERVERQTIKLALARHRGSVQHAAEELGLTRQALYRRIAKYGLDA